MAKKNSPFKKKHYYASPAYDPTGGACDDTIPDHWAQDCETWRGLVLTGRYAHWCPHWDNLPMDETCPEWPCGCREFDA